VTAWNYWGGALAGVMFGMVLMHMIDSVRYGRRKWRDFWPYPGNGLPRWPRR
jgi:hypothetical protein